LRQSHISEEITSRTVLFSSAFQRGPDRAVAVVGEPVKDEVGIERAIVTTRGDADDRQQRAERLDVAGGGILKEQIDRDVEHSRDILGPLDQPADPEQRLGDAAQHGSLRACCCCCC
jgi:hypothetical protein